MKLGFPFLVSGKSRNIARNTGGANDLFYTFPKVPQFTLFDNLENSPIAWSFGPFSQTGEIRESNNLILKPENEISSWCSAEKVKNPIILKWSGVQKLSTHSEKSASF